MSVLQRLITALTPAPQAGPQLPAVQAFGEGAMFTSLDDPYLAQFLVQGNLSGSGVAVNKRVAVKNPTFFRAVNLICSSIGMLPCHLFERTRETVTDEQTGEVIEREVVEKATTHALFSVLHRKPNSFQTPFEFKTQMQADLLFHGSAVAYQRRTVRGQIKELVPLQRSRVSVELNQNLDGIRFFYQPPNGARRELSPLDVFWIRAPITLDGVNGTSLLEVAVEALGLATAAERAQGSIFRNGSIVGGVLEHPKTLTSPAIERLRQQFDDRHSGIDNAGRWIVAEEGLKVSAGPQATGKDAQAVEARKLQVEELGRITGVPRPLLMVDETSWGSGIEQLGLFFVTYCLMPWFVAWEEAISRSLLLESEQERYFAKFNEGALLRGSLKDQAEFFSKALGSGGSPAWFTQNEVRDKFNLKPVDGGDELKGGAGAPEGGGDDEGTGASGQEGAGNDPPQGA